MISLPHHVNYENYGAGDHSICERGQELHVRPYFAAKCSSRWSLEVVGLKNRKA